MASSVILIPIVRRVGAHQAFNCVYICEARGADERVVRVAGEWADGSAGGAVLGYRNTGHGGIGRKQNAVSISTGSWEPPLPTALVRGGEGCHHRICIVK